MKKKFFILIFSFLTIFFFGFNVDKAEAATHSWQSIPGAGSTCEVRAWTDYLSYTSSANTVDFYLESRGNCGTLEYSGAPYVILGGNYIVGTLETGSFSFRTPVKQSTLSTINVRPISGALIVSLSKNGTVIGTYQSDRIEFP
ncbi:hypothetical protein [Oceanobacillus jeddahense]|uniref:hypothetical protein n=1 Tax=Oceanobacillus jeddahense TaxID=1462527 RepID=UPI000693AC71|nr:hypothetical protein [Oceanobacillus jeddahense]